MRSATSMVCYFSDVSGDETLKHTVPAGAYDANGIDRTLIRWMLSLTPTERLAYVQGAIDLQKQVRRLNDGHR